MNSYCADILLFSAYKWNISRPSLVTDVGRLTFVYDTSSWSACVIHLEQRCFTRHNQQQVLDWCSALLGWLQHPWYRALQATGSLAWSLWSSRPWPRSWRLTQHVTWLTSCASPSTRVFSCILLSPRSPTSTARTTPSCSPTRSSGLSTTLTCTVLLSTRRSRIIWDQWRYLHLQASFWAVIPEDHPYQCLGWSVHSQMHSYNRISKHSCHLSSASVASLGP